MKRYKTIGDWAVLDEIRNGATVYVVDKAKRGNLTAIRIANEIPIWELFEIFDCLSETECDRYEFYKIETIMNDEVTKDDKNG